MTRSADAHVYDNPHGTRDNRTAVTPPGGATPTSLGYDQANRLTSVTTPGVAGNQGQYTSVGPSRILDTRGFTRTGSCPTTTAQCVTIPAGSTLTLQVTGKGSIPTTGVSAVALNVSTVGVGGTGFLSVYSADLANNTSTSNLNFTPSVGATNMVVTKVSASGQIKITASGASTDVVVDTEGWYSTPTGTAGGELTVLNPTRAVDTRADNRTGACPTSAAQCTTLGAGGTLTVQMTGHYGIPATGVAAVLVNLTPTITGANGTLTAYPADTAKPNTTNATYTQSVTVAVLSQVKVSASGQIEITSSAPTDVVIDVEGWISSASSGAQSYTPLDPARVLDTRAATRTGICSPSCATLGTNATISVQVAGLAGVPPTGASAVVVNLGATNATGIGTLAAYASGEARPTGTSLIYRNGADTSDLAVVKLGADGRIAITNNTPLDLVIDVQGWYSAATGTWTYTYAPDGLRTRKTGPGTNTTYSWDRSGPLPMLLAESSASVGTTYYLYGPGGLPVEQINPTGSVYYLHHDKLGSTRLVTNVLGTTSATATYDAYGRPTATTGTATSRLGYGGQYVDAETGYQYLRARFYDPTTGTFLSRDPLTPLTRSAYGYAGNNPLNASDPSGLFGFSDIKRMASDAVGFVEDHTGDAVSAVGAVGRVVLNNAPIGGFGPSVNELGMMLAGPGANCHGLPGLHAECDNSLVHLDGDAPFTVGDVVLNPKGGPITDRDLLEHEMNHSNQWAAFGVWPFLPAYMFDRFVVHDGNGACSWFEQAADARKGGYGACGC